MDNLPDYIVEALDGFVEKNMKRILIFLFALMIGMAIGVTGAHAATIPTPTPVSSPTTKPTGPIPITVGTVNQTPDLAITISNDSGQTVSFKIDPKTTTIEAPTIASLKGKLTAKNITPGDRIAIVSSDQATANLIVIASHGATTPPKQDTAFLGIVSSRDATTSGTILSLKHPKEDTFAKALVNANTKIIAKDIAKPTTDDIKAGDKVLVTGPTDSNNVITATELFLIPGKARALIDKLAPLASSSASSSAKPSATPKKASTSAITP